MYLAERKNASQSKSNRPSVRLYRARRLKGQVRRLVDDRRVEGKYGYWRPQPHRRQSKRKVKVDRGSEVDRSRIVVKVRPNKVGT